MPRYCKRNFGTYWEKGLKRRLIYFQKIDQSLFAKPNSVTDFKLWIYGILFRSKTITP